MIVARKNFQLTSSFRLVFKHNAIFTWTAWQKSLAKNRQHFPRITLLSFLPIQQNKIVGWRAGTSIRVVVPAPHNGNRFLCSLKGLRIRALYLF